MNTKGYSHIPSTLFECITFIVRALPVRSVPMFIELLVGAIITQAGFVTEAWLAINPVRSRTAYYKWLQHEMVLGCAGSLSGQVIGHRVPTVGMVPSD